MLKLSMEVQKARIKHSPHTRPWPGDSTVTTQRQPLSSNTSGGTAKADHGERQSHDRGHGNHSCPRADSAPKAEAGRLANGSAG